ncbi:MAG: hypothetical protein K6E91_10595 [Butyrivibrio sp.]|nr:hypothetical protein [Butyrivibrio sp.]
MAKKILAACFSASGVTKRVGEEIKRCKGHLALLKTWLKHATVVSKVF